MPSRHKQHKIKAGFYLERAAHEGLHSLARRDLRSASQEQAWLVAQEIAHRALKPSRVEPKE